MSLVLLDLLNVVIHTQRLLMMYLFLIFRGGHSFTAEEAADVLKWLVATLELETLKEVDETPDFMEVKDPVNEEETGGPAENVTISECLEQQSMFPIDGQHTNHSITVL